MIEQWNELIDRLIEICSPAAYLDFSSRTDGEENIEPEYMPSVYLHVPRLLITSGMIGAVMSLPGSDLSMIAEGLNRLWRAVIDERDTDALNDDDADEDERWLEELEELRDETDGMLAALEAYAEEADTGLDPDALIQQSILLTAANLAEARRAFARAGNAILRGVPHWPLWPSELDIPPAGEWIRGLSSLIALLKVNGWFPLAPLAEQRQKLAGDISPDKVTLGLESDDDAEEENLSPDEEKLMGILLSGNERLTDDQLAVMPAFTPQIIQRLIDVLHDPEYEMEDSPGGGYAPIHAATLLGKTKSPDAVVPLLIALHSCDPEDILWSAIIFALEDFGRLALPALLDSMQYSADATFKLGVAGVLGKAGRGDERAFRALEAYYNETAWDDDRVPAVNDLTELGDPRALPILRRALNDRDITPMGIHETVAAIKELDPEADPVELKKIETKARQRYDNQRVIFDKRGQAFCRDCGSLMEKDLFGEWQHVEIESTPARAIPNRPFSPAPEIRLPEVDPRFNNVGRNDPCPCGSGKKYKHCHGSAKPTVH